MVVVREFEFFESENCIVVFPCEGLGATQGEDLQERSNLQLIGFIGRSSMT